MSVSASSSSSSNSVASSSLSMPLVATPLRPRAHAYILRPETIQSMTEQVSKGQISNLTRIATAFSKKEFKWGAAYPQANYKMMQLMATAIKESTFPAELAKTVACNFLKYNIFAGMPLPEDVTVKCKNGEVTFNKTVLQLLSPYFRNLFTNSKKEEKLTVDDLSRFNTENLQILKEHYNNKKFNINYDISLESLEELAELAELVKEPVLVEQSRNNAKALLNEKQLKEFLETLPKEPILEAAQRPQRLTAIERFLTAAEYSFKKTENGLLLEHGTACALLEASESSPYLPEFVQGIFCTTKETIQNMLLSDLCLSTETRNLVKELRLEVAPEIDELSQFLKLFPKVEKITLPFIGQRTVRNSPEALIEFYDTTELCKILMMTKQHTTLKQIHFLRALPDGYRLILSHELITALGNAQAALAFDDPFQFSIDPADNAWFKADAYKENKDTVATLLSAAAPFKNYTIKKPYTTGFAFESK